MARTVSVTRESWPLAGAFRISRGTRTRSEIVVAEVREGAAAGRGECLPYARYGETMDATEAAIRAAGAAVAAGAGRAELASLLPPGAARNALDCALWDLEAKLSGRRAWEVAGLPAPGPVETVYTLGADAPEAMAARAAACRDRPSLKLKLVGDGLDIERVAAIRAAAPAARLVVDANEGWTAGQYRDHAPRLAALGVAAIEQPLPAADDGALADLPRPVPVCADESCHDAASAPALAGKYDMANIKLDKTGGLTEALRLRDAARAAGLRVMVGCMVGTSLAMAPAVLVAQGADLVDLDGPLLLAGDRDPGLAYEGALVHPPPPALWG